MKKMVLFIMQINNLNYNKNKNNKNFINNQLFKN